MPVIIPNTMFAPCGMNCQVCYVHLEMRKHGTRCNGCQSHSANKPNHCRNCKIKDCVREKTYTYCFECSSFPCKLIKNLEKSYLKRYNVSLIENSNYVKKKGAAEFMAAQRKIWVCPHCGGAISLHDQVCSDCGKSVAV